LLPSTLRQGKCLLKQRYALAAAALLRAWHRAASCFRKKTFTFGKRWTAPCYLGSYHAESAGMAWYGPGGASAGAGAGAGGGRGSRGAWRTLSSAEAGFGVGRRCAAAASSAHTLPGKTGANPLAYGSSLRGCCSPSGPTRLCGHGWALAAGGAASRRRHLLPLLRLHLAPALAGRPRVRRGVDAGAVAEACLHKPAAPYAARYQRRLRQPAVTCLSRQTNIRHCGSRWKALRAGVRAPAAACCGGRQAATLDGRGM